MKKFLIALLMMAVVFASVFAADGYKGQGASAASSEGTAQINITTTIAEEWPKFQLATKTGVTANVTDAVTSSAVDFTEAELTSALNGNLTAADGQTVSVGFAINQISDSRTKDNFTLTVSATDLVLVTPVVGDAIAFDNANRTADQIFTVVSDEPAVTAVTGNTVANINPTASDNVLTTAYNGKKVKTNSAIELGTFTVSWNTNTNAEAGDYEAHIILTVAAV